MILALAGLAGLLGLAGTLGAAPALAAADPAAVLWVVLQAGGEGVIARAAALPTNRWFTVGYVAWGVGAGLTVAARYVGYQREVRASGNTVDTAEAYVWMFLFQARVTSVSTDAPSRLLQVLAAVVTVPALVWWFGWFARWLLVGTPGGVVTKLQLLFAGLLVIVSFMVLGMSLAIPLCVGIALYVETLARGVAVLLGRGP